eukprot:403335652
MQSQRSSSRLAKRKVQDSVSPKPSASIQNSAFKVEKHTLLPYQSKNRVQAPMTIPQIEQRKAKEEIELEQELIEFLEDLYSYQYYDGDQVIEASDLDYLYDEPEDIANDVRDQCMNQANTRKLDLGNIVMPINLLEQAICPPKLLIELRLSSCGLIAKDCRILSSMQSLCQLRSLDLSCNKIKIQGLLYLLEDKYSNLGQLRKLELFSCKLSEKQVQNVSDIEMKAKKLQLKQLTSLNLSYNKLGIFAQKLLSKQFGLIAGDIIETLSLIQCNLEDNFIKKTFVDLTKSLPNLIELDMSHNSFEETYKSIMTSLQSNCSMLTNLSLASNRFLLHVMQDMTITKVPDQPGFLNLKRLDLSSSLKGDLMITGIAESNAFDKVEFLRLRNCNINNEGFMSLVESSNLRSVTHLILSKNNIQRIKGPFKDLKEASEMQVTRYIMKLALLDISQNPIQINYITMYLPKAFLSNTVILSHNGKIKKKFDQIEIPYKATKLNPTDFKLKYNPILVVNPTLEQSTFLKNI